MVEGGGRVSLPQGVFRGQAALMYVTMGAPQKGRSQARRSSTTGSPRATSTKSANDDKTASEEVPARMGKPDATAWAWSHSPST